MADNVLASLGCVKLSDLVPSEGLPSDSFKLSVSTLSQSLAQYSAAIVQFSASEGALIRSGLDSARLYFHQKPLPLHTEDNQISDPSDWCKTSGYSAYAPLWEENYDYRPGLIHMESSEMAEFPPGGLSDIFSLLAKAARDILDALGFYLNLRSSPFRDILDNVPLRNQEISSSVLKVSCHLRPSFHAAQQHNLSSHENQVDKSLISIMKSDKAGLFVSDFNGRWVLVDGDLAPHEAIVFSGLALCQVTASYFNPAMYRTDTEVSNSHLNIHGRCSFTFKLMPKSMTVLNCSEMREAGHGVDPQFQIPIPVDEFMQKSSLSSKLLSNHPHSQSSSFPISQDGPQKPMTMMKSDSRSKPLPPSKRLRLEAQRVLKEKVQEIAERKGIKMKYCNLKECEIHMQWMDSPCASIRKEMGWPSGVPFVHPHDLPNKAKIGFLEAYEPGWTVVHGMELNIPDPAPL